MILSPVAVRYSAVTVTVIQVEDFLIIVLPVKVSYARRLKYLSQELGVEFL